jgi:hypothetical protein
MDTVIWHLELECMLILFLLLILLGYNPKRSRDDDCTRHCGNVSVQFPFGLEEGCFAREQFRLVCENATSLPVLALQDFQVNDIDVNKGTINFTNLYQDRGGIYALTAGRNLFAGYRLFNTVQWVVANLSCLEAQRNASGYACVSYNSTCLEVNMFNIYVGYRCKCTDGFQGNPYIQSGCRGISFSLSLVSSFSRTVLSHPIYISNLQISMSAFFKEIFVRAESAVMLKEASCVLNALARLSMLAGMPNCCYLCFK